MTFPPSKRGKNKKGYSSFARRHGESPGRSSGQSGLVRNAESYGASARANPTKARAERKARQIYNEAVESVWTESGKAE